MGSSSEGRRVRVVDCTLRDGEQAPGIVFRSEEKLALARTLSELGVDTLDAGFPSVSEDERAAFTKIVASAPAAKVGATVRCDARDIELAHAIGATSIFMFHAVSDVHMKFKLVVDRQQVERRVREMCELSRTLGLETYFVGEDSARQEVGWIAELCDLAAASGAAGAILCDTVGVMTPRTMAEHVRGVRERMESELPLGIHCHNDFGLAVANTLAAVAEGVEIVTCTVNGIGERAGNAALEETVVALELLEGVDTGIDVSGLPKLAANVERLSGFFNAPHKAIVGRNVFTHESGVHVHGMLSNPLCYEAIPPERVGRESRLVLGKHSGKALVRELLAQRHITAADGDLVEILGRVKEVKEAKSKRFDGLWASLENHYDEMVGLSETEFWEIANAVLAMESAANE